MCVGIFAFLFTWLTILKGAEQFPVGIKEVIKVLMAEKWLQNFLPEKS